MPDQAPDRQAREFAAAFREFLDWIHSPAAGAGSDNEVSALVRDFLGPDGTHHSVVTRDLPRFEHVNLQTAIDTWCARAGRVVEVRGIAMPPHYGGLSLQQLVGGDGLPPIRLTAPALTDLPNGPGSTLGCLRLAVLLVSDELGRYVVMIQAPNEHQPSLQVEVAGLPVRLAQRLLADLDQLRAELNVYCGRLLDVSLDPMGGVILAFADLPGLSREDVVLPSAVLARVERHALGVAGHREKLLATGQHLKRGLLLYGPPGTGKTHTTRYLLGQMNGYTRLVLTGRSLVAVGAVTDLARALVPSVVVLEDVDLVAEERSLGPSSSPVLFDLLDAMDGAAPDADLLFLLTTNRADLLEPALAARPGRVDIAVEITLPDALARERLLTLYGQNVPLDLTQEDVQLTVERTDGTTASFLKELIRRAVLEALHDDPALSTVTGAHLARALDDLLDAAQAVTRTLLGVGVDPADLQPGGALSAGPGRVGWMPHGPRAMARGFVRYSGLTFPASVWCPGALKPTAGRTCCGLPGVCWPRSAWRRCVRSPGPSRRRPLPAGRSGWWRRTGVGSTPGSGTSTGRSSPASTAGRSRPGRISGWTSQRSSGGSWPGGSLTAAGTARPGTDRCGPPSTRRSTCSMAWPGSSARPAGRSRCARPAAAGRSICSSAACSAA
jgi:hypothetical protein